MEEGIIKLGPWGGARGSKWSQCGDSAVEKIIIVHGWAIDFMEFFTNSEGRDLWSKGNGGPVGLSKDEININFPEEYITSISGHIGEFDGYEVIRSLKLLTNLDQYGPFGGEEGTPFSLPIHGGIIVGFHGRKGKFLHSLGIFVKPFGALLSKYNEMKICSAVSRVALTLPSIEGTTRDICCHCPTAWGGVGGKPWDDGVFTGIKEIYVHTDGTVLNSIEVSYKSEDSTEISRTHGSSRGTTLHRAEFDESEYLVSISGYYGAEIGTGSCEVIKSLTFLTNKSMYGPIGEEVGKYFSTSFCSSGSGMVVGFFGRSSIYLDAIGVHMHYF